ncbi:MAG TPA: DUF4390 domain-containing protein [Gemmatimonadaceae bacterium]|nr:DUF4390 domain-containing protein [Gemmatimonadaceae bacterium]
MRSAALALCIAGLLAAPLDAQPSARLELSLPPGERPGREPPFVRTTSVLSTRRVRELLHSGFPARLHYRLELWSTRGWFDDLKARAEWDVIVRYSPLDRSYVVARVDGDRATPLGTYSRLDEVEAVIGSPFQPAIRLPGGRARHYYNAVLDVEMLSVNDLDEVERWLRGELRPAVRGERNPGTAVTRGVRTLVVTLLGAEGGHYEARTRTFRP